MECPEAVAQQPDSLRRVPDQVVFPREAEELTSARNLLTRSPYWPVIAHPTLRRLFPGITLSFIGDGISVVAVVMLAQELTGSAALVGLAVTASTLPGAIGAMTLGRWLSHRSGADLARWDALLRFVAIGLIPLAYLAGILGIGLLIGLLAVSSVLHSWGTAGRFTLVAEVLPEKDHLAGNALMAMLAEMGTIVGPPLAALILVFWDPAGALAIDALSFGLLAVSYHFIRRAGGTRREPPADASRSAGFSVIWRTPALLGLIALSAGFFFLFGPVYVALPILLREESGSGDGGAGLLATFYTLFGVGAVLGGILAPFLQNLSRWLVTVSGVLVVGLGLLPLGLGAPIAVSVACFALGGLSWAPYQATSMALYQRTAPEGRLAQVLAADSAIALLAAPGGTAVGGAAAEAFGARNTLLSASVAMMLIAALAAVLLLISRRPGAAKPSGVVKDGAPSDVSRAGNAG